MRARHGRSLRATALAALEGLGRLLTHTAAGVARLLRGRPRAPRSPATGQAPAHADERTARRVAEAQRGGLSSAESAARWASGSNCGGTHHKAVRHDEPERPRPSDDEPQDPKERMPGGVRHMATNRRG